MLREARVSIPLDAAPAATPSRRRRLKATAEVLLVLFRLAITAVLGAFLAGLFACSLGSALRVLGRWICGEGSVLKQAGGAILVIALEVVMALSVPFFVLFQARLFEHYIFVVIEAGNKKQYPAGSAAPHLPKGDLSILYLLPFVALAFIAMRMIPSAEKGSLELRVGSVLLDIAILGGSLVAGFLVVPKMVVLLMITCKAKERQYIAKVFATLQGDSGKVLLPFIE